MKNLIRLILVVLILFAKSSYANTYYVSTSGSDSNPGTSSQPFKSLSKAESIVSAGDIVMINDGTYYINTLTVTRSGSNENLIQYKAINSGKVTLNGTINVMANFRVFDGFSFNNSAETIVTLDGSSNRILNCSFTGNWTRAILINKSRSSNANNNLVQDVSITASGSTGYGIQIGSDANSGGESANNNILDRVNVVGINKGTIHGILFGGGCNGNVFKNSYISNTYYGIVDKRAVSSLVYNNVFNNTASSIYTSIYAKGARNSSYYNNVIRNISAGYGIIVSDDQTSMVSSGLVIKNNVFIKNNSEAAIFRASSPYGTNTFSSDYNLFQYSSGALIMQEGSSNYSSLSSWQSASGQDSHSITGTSTFENSSGTMNTITDYKPLAGSPVINVGSSVSNRTTDAAGNSISNTPDIGPYESQSSTSSLKPSTTGKTYFVSTSGNDSNPGTIDRPFRTLQKINTLSLQPGDIVYIRKGTYMSGTNSDKFGASLNITNKNGTPENPILISAYPPDFPDGGRVVFDCSDYNHPNGWVNINVSNCSYIRIYGIRTTGNQQSKAGAVHIGWWIGQNGNPNGNITLENCEADHIGHTGFRLDDTNNATFLNCDAHHIDNPYDPGVQRHGGSDGFGRYNPSNRSENTVYKGCRAWFCSDDGWDLFGSPGKATWDGCWAFWNGYVQDVFPLTHSRGGVEWGDGNGFKMGSNTTPQDHSNVKRVFQNCVAFENYKHGFDQNLADVKTRFYNNTTFKCNYGYFMFGEVNPPLEVKNNIVFQCNTSQNFRSANTTLDKNDWGVSSSDFASLDSRGVDGARQADGSLPALNFLRLTPNSKLIDAGANVGLPYNGSAPDLGAFEYGGAVSVSNQAPVANAGSDQSFFFPTSSASLSGSGSDHDGSISSYQWTKISGPSQFKIVSPTSAKTDITDLVVGTYQFELKVTDNGGATGTDIISISVKTPGNQPPVANAGSNKTITLPANSVTLDGTGSKDADGSISAYAWSKVSGPAQGSIANAATASTTATNLAQGTYIFKVTVTDNSNATASDSVFITVNAAINQLPVVNAGANQTIKLPTNTVTLNGSALDADGTIASYVWTKDSGPAQGNITSAANATTTVTGLVQGTYTFKLTATDNKNGRASDLVTITVNAAVTNQPPVANAGTSQVITLPVNSVNLNGSASTDPDGKIASYSWTKTSGGTATISNANSNTATVSNLKAGQYTFELTVTDNGGAASKATVKVTVLNQNSQKPVADAGTAQTITLPTNSATLNGNASIDPDGTISTYQWSKINGPTQGSITSAAKSITTVNNLVAGLYTFKLVVTDNSGNSSSDSVTVTVIDAANEPPIANAGLSQTLPFGTKSVELDGSASSDADGKIASYKWILISGDSVAISNNAIAKPVISNLKGGEYIFELTVTDNKGATAKSRVKILVSLSSNEPPIADAGANQVIVLPVNSTKLDGTKSYDSDGTIAFYNWTKTDGPSAVTITDVNTATPTVSGLVSGVYTFLLSVTDNRGAITETVVKINVLQSANQLPVADGGGNQIVNLPGNNIKATSVRLDGTKSNDPDGTLVFYTWKKIDGPTAIMIENVNTPTPTVSGLREGQYTFELTVTDNSGATATDRISIVVKPYEPVLVADAGKDISIYTPESTAILNGSGSHDSQGGGLNYKWEQVQGASTSSLSNASASQLTVSKLVPGTYTFKITVTNRLGMTASDEVKVVVVDSKNGFAQVNLYPNPASDIINAKIVSDSIGIVALNIYDINGRAMKKVELNKQLVDNLRQQVQRGNTSSTPSSPNLVSFTLPVNIASLGKGIYVLETIVDGKVKVASKFVKY